MFPINAVIFVHIEEEFVMKKEDIEIQGNRKYYHFKYRQLW